MGDVGVIEHRRQAALALAQLDLRLAPLLRLALELARRGGELGGALPLTRRSSSALSRASAASASRRRKLSSNRRRWLRCSSNESTADTISAVNTAAMS